MIFDYMKTFYPTLGIDFITEVMNFINSVLKILLELLKKQNQSLKKKEILFVNSSEIVED